MDARIVRLLGAALGLVAREQPQQHCVGRAEGLLVNRLAHHPVHHAGHVLAVLHGEAHVAPHLVHVRARLHLVQHLLAPAAQEIGSVGHQVGETVAVEIRRVHDDAFLLDHVVQQKAEIGVGDVFGDFTAPGLHSGLEILRQERDDRVDVVLVLFVGIDRIAALQLELRALEHPAHDAGVDRVFLRLGRLGRDAADLAGFVHHLQEQAHCVGHAHAGSVHFRVDIAGAAVDGEFFLVLRIRQAGHEPDARDRAVRPDIAVHAGGRAQWRIRGFAVHHDLPAVLVHQEIAGGRPFERRELELAEPVQRHKFRVVPELRHHRHAKERKPEDVESHHRAVQREHVRERVGDRLYAAGTVAPLPNNRVGVAARLDFRAVVDAVQHLEQVAVLLFLGDLQQVEFVSHGA